VPLWAAEGLSPWPARTPNPCRDERGWGREELVLLYSGNLGLGHRFGEFLTAAERLSGSGGLRWVFAGSGRRRGEVERFRREHPGAPVDLLPYAPWNRLREHLCSGDVHLASLDGRWARHMTPSKVQSVLAVGRPLIFVGPPDSVSGRWIAESGAGWVVPEGDVGGVLRAVQEARDPLARERRGMAARAYAERHFDLGANCTRIAGMLEHAAGGGGGGR